VIVLIGVGAAGVGGGLAGDTAVTAASALGQLAQLPFSVLSSLVGVLFIAVPALHYASGETITVQAAFAALLRRPMRYLLAGIVFTLVMSIGCASCRVWLWRW
jgi:hypothetical protein